MKSFTRLLLLVLCLLAMNHFVKAQFNNALSYNSDFANYTTMPNGIVSDISSDFTIELWVNWAGGSDFQRIFDFGNGTDSYMYLTSSENSSNHYVQFGFKLPSLPELQLTGGTLTQNKWTHIAVTIDYSTPATPVGSLYVGGVRVATGSMYSGATPYRPSDLEPTTQNWLGRSQFSGSPYFDPFFDGIIDELRISNTLRYTGASFTPSLTPFAVDGNTVALYHFDEGAEQLTFDAVNAAISGYLGSSSADNIQDPSWILSTLPVKLITFSGQETDKAVRLTWRASTTSESGQFIIERSSDGQRFQPIGTTAFSKTPGTFDYSFDDRNYTGSKNFYRIKILEFNNSSKYSSIILISKNLIYSAYPSAARDQIFLTIPKPTNISIYNSGGALMKRIQLTISQNIYLTDLTTGTYFLRFEASSQTVPFIKL
jgi:hypothetical protein